MKSIRFWQAALLAASLVLLLMGGRGANAQGGASVSLNAPHGWVRVAPPGFGDPTNISVSALQVFNNQLYAATINWAKGGSIYRSSNGSVWEQVAMPGQVSTPYNPAITDMIVFNNKLYIGTAWSSMQATSAKYQVWRYDGTAWETTPVLQEAYPVHGFTAFEVFNNGSSTDLYVGLFKFKDSAEGARIMRSPTGNANSWTTVMENGNGNMNSYAITSLKAFNGYLYAALGNEASGVQVIRSSNGSTWTTVVNNGFGNARNWDAGGFSVFGGAIYLGARNEDPTNFTSPTSTGGVLYRSTDGLTWTPVTTNGFGSTQNVKIEGTIPYANLLYAITYNVQYGDTPATGTQVWASWNGTNWAPVKKNGFGSKYNTNSLWSNASAVFNDHLYIGTSNKDPNNGGELWEMVEYVTFIPFTLR